MTNICAHVKIPNTATGSPTKVPSFGNTEIQLTQSHPAKTEHVIVLLLEFHLANFITRQTLLLKSPKLECSCPSGSSSGLLYTSTETLWTVWDGQPRRPPQPSHSSWALTLVAANTVWLYLSYKMCNTDSAGVGKQLLSYPTLHELQCFNTL